MKFEAIEFVSDNGVAYITLNRPKAYNSFDTILRKEVLEAVTQANEDNEIQVIVLKGAGPGFSAGADLREEFPVPISPQIENEYKPAIEAFFNSPKLTISQVHGRAAGIGAAFAMATDFMVMAEGAGLYLAFAALALVPDGGTVWHLSHAMGRRKALETIIEGKVISPQDCLNYGLANHVVPTASLEKFTNEWATSLTLRAPISVKNVKKLVNMAGELDLLEMISAEGKAQNECQISQDHKRGLRAFIQKEIPVFKGE